MRNISVIGTGNMGKGLTKVFAEAGYHVYLGSREEAKAKEVAAELGNSLVQGMHYLEAVKHGDFVILAVGFQPNNPLLEEMKPFLKEKIVVDISNPLNDTYDGLTTDSGTSASQQIANQLPEVRLVGAFKNTFAANFSDPLFGGLKSNVFVVGDDQKAKEAVIELINSLPFEALDAGGLNVAHTLENMTVMTIGLSMKYGYNWRAGYKVLA
jgi:NADPH-dependent F420 reductase